MGISFEEFLFEEKEPALKKIHSFIKSGKDKLHLVLDFDRTLTFNQKGPEEDMTTWEILATHLSQSALSEYKQYYNKYRPLEIEGRITEADFKTWSERILGLFCESQLKWQDVEKGVDTRMPIRPFAKELFDICREKNISTVIISAGVKNVIDLWCQNYKIKPTLILSTNLTFSPEGYMTGWERDSLINILNKKEKGHQEIEKIRSLRPNTILIGDSLDDVSMAEGEKNVLRIAVYNPRRDDKPDKLKDFMKSFDLVIQDGTLQGVIKILNLF